MKNQQDNNLEKLLEIFFSQRKKIVLITTIITLLGVVYALLATKWYEVEIKILPSETNDNLVLREYASIAALAGVKIPMGGASYHYFYPDILTSNYIIDKVLEHKFWIESKKDSLTLFEFWGTEIDSSEKDWKIKLYAKARKKIRNKYIKIEIDEMTEMIKLNVMAPKDRGLAAELANYLIEQLDIYNRTVRKTTAVEQRRFIEKAIVANKKKLEKAEKKLMRFESQNKDIISPEQRIEHNRLLTDVEIFRNILIELKKQLELVKIEEIKQMPTLNIIEEAQKPYFKKKPQRLIIVISSFILGISFALGYAIINYNLSSIKKSISVLFK